MQFRKKILIIGDDIRHTTGVACILRQVTYSLIDTYDIIQLGLGNNNNVNVVDMSKSVSSSDQSRFFKIYETENTGNINKLRDILHTEDIDCIFLMSDPHKFDWFFQAEHEIRVQCPIYYYHVWDNYPVPLFLKSIYNSCDNIGCISKLTYSILNELKIQTPYSYIPHGVDSSKFYKQSDDEILKNRKLLLGHDYKFVLFCNNSNIPRKQFGLLLDGFNKFYKKINETQKAEVTLLIHTNVNSKTGFDLNKILDDLYVDLPVLLSSGNTSEATLNNMYNLSHCTINVASNEGFGLTTLESVFTHTPVIFTNTGGLKDQYNENWCELIRDTQQILVGSRSTPYIYSDICNSDDISQCILSMYNKYNKINMSSVDEFLMDNKFHTEQMCKELHLQIKKTINNFKPRAEYTFTKVK